MKKSHRLRWFTLFATLLCVHYSGAEERFSFEKTPGKLPKNVVPRHYLIELKPELEKERVEGREVIEIEVSSPAPEIVLNASELEISSAMLAGGGLLKIRFDATNQLVRLSGEKPFARGTHKLHLSFRGKINESGVGMFSMSYSTPGGTKKMLATQFEATEARRVFPCFDEPVFRATFELIAEVPERFEAVSNMPVAGTEERENGWKRVHFKRSPSMPVYLLVLVAGELEEIHDRAGKTETRIWFTEGKKEQARYALENSKRLLAYYEKYFGVKFPLPKLDHIAMPGGFGGAMEHWGAITYNEGRILYDPAKSSQDMKEESFGIMAHEMAHQWFGNIVTMAWWDNLWLNEGFASWMGTKATDALNPDWNHWVRTETGKVALMARDARKSTHAIQRPVASELQIGDAFDDITYEKGKFFIRMLEDYLGEEKFRAGIRRYMKRHAYGNTTTADLWAALEESSGKSVAQFASDWTEQPGLPVILAASRCVNGKQEVELRQERFTLLDPGAAPLRWKVPMSATIVGQNGGQKQALLEREPVTLKMSGCDDAVKLNAGSRGYYRVAYDRPMFERLRAAWDKMAEADRVNFLSDAWAMLETGRIAADDYLNLLPSLANENSLAVWEQMSGSILRIDSLLEGESFQEQFRHRALSFLASRIGSLGSAAKPGESAMDSVLRARMIGLLGALGDDRMIAIARERFAEFLKDPMTLTGDLRAAFLNCVGKHATQQEYDQLVRLAKAAPLEEDRNILIGAFTQARNPEMAQRTLELSLTRDFPPSQAITIVSLVSATTTHAQAAWDFMKKHHRELMTLAQGPFENMWAGTTVAGFADEAHAAEYIEFIGKNYSAEALAKAEEAADQIRYNAHLKRLVIPGARKWSEAQALH